MTLQGAVTDLDRGIGEALSTLAGVRAVSLGGSRAAGLADHGSDTDLYAWYAGPPPAPQDRRSTLVAFADDEVRSYDVFGPEDHWYHAGRLVEVVYLSLDEIARQIERARGEGLAGEVCATAFLYTASAGLPICDPYGDLDRVRADLADFPEATRVRQFDELPLMADEFASQLRKSQSREDWPMVVRRRAGLIDVIASLMFALNRRYHPGEKRLLVHLEHCPLRPAELARRVGRIALTAADDPALADDCLALIAEIVGLYGLSRPVVS